MNDFPKIYLKAKKDDALKRKHPWVFSGAIEKVSGKLSEGCIVEVFSNNNEYLGTGHYNDGSIAVRIFSFERTNADDAFWEKKLYQAFEYRKNLGLTDNPHTNSYRLVFGEGDGLPGLIIDYYNDTAIIQCHTYGMYLHHKTFAEILAGIYKNKIQSVYLKSSETLPEKFAENISDGYLMKGSHNNVITENDCKFYVDWEQGQKTGFFLDQRDNRNFLSFFCKNKKVLNCFSYTGAFSVYALKGDADSVLSIDYSAKAIEMAQRNVELNGFPVEKHQTLKSDVMDYLKNTDDLFDVIILDPPAFAKHIKTKHTAIQGYRRLNAAALKKIKKGGLLFTFSCSQAVNTALFRSAVISAAIDSGRNCKIISTFGQPPDHPVSAFHPEGEYLKGLLLYIE